MLWDSVVENNEREREDEGDPDGTQGSVAAAEKTLHENDELGYRSLTSPTKKVTSPTKTVTSPTKEIQRREQLLDSFGYDFVRAQWLCTHAMYPGQIDTAVHHVTPVVESVQRVVRQRGLDLLTAIILRQNVATRSGRSRAEASLRVLCNVVAQLKRVRTSYVHSVTCTKKKHVGCASSFVHRHHHDVMGLPLAFEMQRYATMRSPPPSPLDTSPAQPLSSLDSSPAGQFGRSSNCLQGDATCSGSVANSSIGTIKSRITGPEFQRESSCSVAIPSTATSESHTTGPDFQRESRPCSDAEPSVKEKHETLVGGVRESACVIGELTHALLEILRRARTSCLKTMVLRTVERCGMCCCITPEWFLRSTLRDFEVKCVREMQYTLRVSTGALLSEFGGRKQHPSDGGVPALTCDVCIECDTSTLTSVIDDVKLASHVKILSVVDGDFNIDDIFSGCFEGQSRESRWSSLRHLFRLLTVRQRVGGTQRCENSLNISGHEYSGSRGPDINHRDSINDVFNSPQKDCFDSEESSGYRLRAFSHSRCLNLSESDEEDRGLTVIRALSRLVNKGSHELGYHLFFCVLFPVLLRVENELVNTAGVNPDSASFSPKVFSVASVRLALRACRWLLHVPEVRKLFVASAGIKKLNALVQASVFTRSVVDVLLTLIILDERTSAETERTSVDLPFIDDWYDTGSSSVRSPTTSMQAEDIGAYSVLDSFSDLVFSDWSDEFEREKTAKRCLEENVTSRKFEDVWRAVSDIVAVSERFRFEFLRRKGLHVAHALLRRCAFVLLNMRVDVVDTRLRLVVIHDVDEDSTEFCEARRYSNVFRATLTCLLVYSRNDLLVDMKVNL